MAGFAQLTDAGKHPDLSRAQILEWLRAGAQDSQWLPCLRLDAWEQQGSELGEWSEPGWLIVTGKGIYSSS